MIKITVPLLLLTLGMFNKIHNEQIISEDENKRFIAMHVKITKIISLQKASYFDYNTNHKGIMLPRGDKETIYLSKEDYVNLNK
jgi:hypothetical protein